MEIVPRASADVDSNYMLQGSNYWESGRGATSRA
jgi:hypothetical protein